MAHAHLILTDVVVKAQEGAAELCPRCQQSYGTTATGQCWAFIPLSPFMMTHIRDPTHLSMSSGVVCQ